MHNTFFEDAACIFFFSWLGGIGEIFLEKNFGNLDVLLGSWIPSLILYLAGAFLYCRQVFCFLHLKCQLVAVRKPFDLCETQGDS